VSASGPLCGAPRLRVTITGANLSSICHNRPQCCVSTPPGDPLGQRVTMATASAAAGVFNRRTQTENGGKERRPVMGKSENLFDYTLIVNLHVTKIRLCLNLPLF